MTLRCTERNDFLADFIDLSDFPQVKKHTNENKVCHMPKYEKQTKVSKSSLLEI
jgi:hypothetical protein